MGAPAAPRPRGLAPAACCLAACLLPRAGALPEAVVQGSPLRALAQPHAELDLTRPPGVVYPQRYPPRDDPRERPLAEAQKSRVNQATGVHKVQHVALLNKPGLWAIMAAIIICIGSSVIRMEFIEASADPEQCSVPGSLSKDSLAGADEGRGKGRQILGLTPQSFLRLIVSIVGLNFAMLFWGIAQEYMMTTVYEDSLGNEEKMPSALCLVLFNRLCTMALAGSLLWVERGRAAVLEPVSWIAAMPSATNLLASWCQYQSLAYVSFPLQTAAKSAKLLPVIVISTLRGKRHTILDYAEGLVIVSALVVFGFELDGGSESVEVSGKGLGVLFLCGLLCFDSITPHFQDYMFQKHPEMSLIQATFFMAMSATGICFAILVGNGQLAASLSFFYRHPDAILHLVVLSLCSSMTQFMITFTIKHFGPVVFILITTTRQLISVCVSAVLFMHHITTLAWLSALVVFLTVIGRALRKPTTAGTRAAPGMQPDAVPEVVYAAGPPTRQQSLVDLLANKESHWKLLVCALGIHVPLGVYSVAQEFMATHTFNGELFRYPMFLIAANRTAASIFALSVLKMQGLPIWSAGMHLSIIPAASNIVATYCQYKALAFLRYPAQALLKAAKVLPVMLCGRALKNRTYSALDYCEGILITILVCFFMWNFHQDKEALSSAKGALTTGVLLMVGYLLTDSLTSNAEDRIYQHVHLDPGHMLLGMQAASGIVAWCTLLVSGQLGPAVLFLAGHSKALVHVFVLVLAEACGAYACTVTVRLFGPAVFTLLLMSHQILSLLISVALFNHRVSPWSCFCLVVVALVVLTSSIRRVTTTRQGVSKEV